MTEPEFDFLRAFLKARSGLALTPDKQYLAESRLEPVRRHFGLESLAALVAALRAGRDPDLEISVLEAMTINETFFFRDKIPFDLFKEVLLPRYMKARAASKRLRIWCAAASTGQEPYSLAMLLDEARPSLAGWRIEILATDLSKAVIDRAKAGLYTQFEVQRGLPIQLLLKHFTQVGDQWQISPKIREMVSFRTANLIRDFTPFGFFDIIYCRNVLIYFDTATKSAVLQRLAAALAPDGALVLGAAETVLGLTEALVPEPDHRGLYARADAPGLPPVRVAGARHPAFCATPDLLRAST
ncbi:CheR family methyltransferase [Microvirga massiliensis]|uniref:CheR family methyltransferase n=1 Tax=Microvirga massiliensis TaxID=1033741 RepID=UPI00062B4599|nr:protein-glutamate O-methyltransferase CheR [Microvirga massiliensis]